MINKNNSLAYPVTTTHIHADGLTKRELFAAVAMQGFASLQGSSACFESIEEVGQLSTKWADALIAALNEEETVA